MDDNARTRFNRGLMWGLTLSAIGFWGPLGYLIWRAS